MRFVIQRHHRYHGIGPCAAPCQRKGVFGPCHLQHHISAAMVAVGQHKGFAFFGPANQHLRVVLPHKRGARGVLLAHDQALRVFQHGAQQRADARGPCADNQHGILFPDLRNARRPEARGQNIPHKECLLIRNTVRNFGKALIGIGHAHKFGLPAVYAAAQRPSAVCIGAVVHPAVFAKEAFAAKGFHIHSHSVAGAHGFYFAAHGLHNAHHFVPHRNAGHSAGHRAVLDVQIAGANGAQRYPHNGIPRGLQRRFGLIHKGKFAVPDICECFHSPPPYHIFPQSRFAGLFALPNILS